MLIGVTFSKKASIRTLNVSNNKDSHHALYYRGSTHSIEQLHHSNSVRTWKSIEKVWLSRAKIGVIAFHARLRGHSGHTYDLTIRFRWEAGDFRAATLRRGDAERRKTWSVRKH